MAGFLTMFSVVEGLCIQADESHMQEDLAVIDLGRLGFSEEVLGVPFPWLAAARAISSPADPLRSAEPNPMAARYALAFHPAMTKFINPPILPLLLCNYTMGYEIMTPLETPYANPSRYGVREATALDDLYGPFSPWLRNSDAEKLTPDDALLKEALSAYTSPREATLAERVFGSQARQQKIGLRHLANVLYERTLLHNKHVRDIDHRLTEFLDRLSVLKMHFPLGEARSQQQLEKLIIELERQRDEEEISFWKDSAEIRQQLFDSAAAYGSAQRRKDMLYGVEVSDV